MILIRFAAVFSFLLFASSDVAFARLDAVSQTPVAPLKPMIFFLAKGAPDSCGSSCDTWIAMHGDIDPGAAARFRKFLVQIGRRDLPIVVHSPGGNAHQAIALGRMIHARKARIVVGLTIPDRCQGNGLDQACDSLRKSNREVPSRLGHLSSCWSACVYLFAAGQIREVPAGATIKVHSPRMLIMRGGQRFEMPLERQAEAQRRIKSVNQQLERYLKEVGGDPSLVKFASLVPATFFHTLTREQLLHFGLDARDVSDTGWFSAVKDGKRAGEVRVFRKGWDGGDNFTEIGVRIGCAPAEKAVVQYFARGGPASIMPGADVIIGIGDHKIRLNAMTAATAGAPDARATLVERDVLMQLRLASSISIVQELDGNAVLLTAFRQFGFASLINDVVEGCASPVVIGEIPAAPASFGQPTPMLNIFGGGAGPFGAPSNTSQSDDFIERLRRGLNARAPANVWPPAPVISRPQQ